jgi:prepilin-type N-terminal cleavage/methylation domain-containing protein
MKNKLIERQMSKKGFSLIETLVAVLIFSLAVTMLAGTFSSFLKNYARAKRDQHNIENAQYAMNIMAKTIRTSAVNNGSTFPLKIYDYSQGLCIEYSYSGNKIQYRTSSTPPSPLTDPSTCDFTGITSEDLTSDIITSAQVNAIATTTSPTVFGRVTISLNVGDTTKSFPIQMSVSLRQ